jgi:hypothetical protein
MLVQTSVYAGAPVKVPFTTMLDPALHNRVKVFAAKRRLSMRDFVENACRQLLKSEGETCPQVSDKEFARIRERMRDPEFPLHLALLIVELLARGQLALSGADLILDVWDEYQTFEQFCLRPEQGEG